MSVINQMLNQLEERGVGAATEQGMVRVVPHTRRNLTVSSLLAIVVLLGVVAIWQWTQSRDRKNVTKVAPVSIEPAAETVDTVKLEQPGLQLSVELGSLPLPSTLRNSANFPALSRIGGDVRSSGEGSMLKASGAPQNIITGQALADKPVVATPAESSSATHQISVTPPIKQVSAGQQADAEFRKAVALMQQGRITDALAGYESVLRLDANHDAARQALAALLLENKRGSDAERVLQDGLTLKPAHVVFAMTLARLQVERGAVEQSVETLEKYLPYAGSQADYHAFLAALLQRQNRNGEAITQYQIALQIAPDNGAWQMGYGISLQALERNVEARNAFKRALDTRTLTPELQAFVEQRIKGL